MESILDPVEGFSVFTSSKSKTEADGEGKEHIGSEILEGKKEYYRQLEVTLFLFVIFF